MSTEAARPPATTYDAGRTRPILKPAADNTKRARKLDLQHRYFLQIADLVALAASAFVGAVAVSYFASPTRAGDLGLRSTVLVALAMAVALHLHGMYRRPAARLRPSEWWRPTVIARCLPTAVLLALAADAFFLDHPRMITLTAAVAMTLPAVLLVPLGRRLVVRMFEPNVSRILVIGTGPITDRLTSRLQGCPDTLVVGNIDDNVATSTPVLGGLADLPAVCAKNDIDRVIIAFPNTSDANLLGALRQLGGDVLVSEIPRYFELHNWRSEAEELHGLTLMHLPTVSLSLSARLVKRFMDTTLAICALVFLSPILLATAVAIRLDTPGPVFFRQERIGRSGRPFRIFKFRSMTVDAPQRRDSVAQLNELDGPVFVKMESDPRVTRVGRFIRKTSLDELPQLFNVVRGEMSLVGPRPMPTEEAERLDGDALARLGVKPGITGLWQVSGRSDLSYADREHLDSIYVQSWSLMWDVRIMAKTPRAVFGHKGAY
ncbi:MAG: sugar transferase [Actinomycetia bacterium]|nr:sugar transferase [Actinomycetes bacterium]